MAFKTFAPGVLTSSDVNTFLMRQTVITCTSGTRPSSPSEGMTVYETDTDCYRTYDGSAWQQTAKMVGTTWQTFTPTLGGTGWSWGTTTASVTYSMIGKLCIAVGRLSIGTGVSIGSGRGQMTLPVEPASTTGIPIGNMQIYDASAGKEWPGNIAQTTISGTKYGIFNLFAVVSSIQVNTVGITTSTISGLSVPISSGDVWDFTYFYEAA